MTHSVVAKLIAKDLYFNRWFIVIGTFAGLVSMLLTGVNQIVANIMFVTIIVVCGIFMGIVSVTRERMDKSSLFVLSLPISTLQYTAAKVLAASISFLTLWIVLFVAGLLLMQLDPAPSAGVPTYVGLMTLLLTNFFVLLAVGVITSSELWVAAAIILTNATIPLFLGSSNPPNAENLDAPAAQWSSTLLAAFTAEAAIILLCLGLIFYIQSNRKDFV